MWHFLQPPSRIPAQLKRLQRTEESYERLGRGGGGKDNPALLQEKLTGLCSLVEELHKLVRQPHQQIVYRENMLHQVLLMNEIVSAEVQCTGAASATFCPGHRHRRSSAAL